MSVIDKVQDVIEDFCDNYQSFTSLDVSNRVKQEGFPGVRHREVAEEIRNQYDQGFIDSCYYLRTLIDVELLNGLRAKAYLYHHNTVNPDTYIDRSQVAIIPTQAQDDDVTVTQDDTNTQNVQSSDDTQDTVADGTQPDAEEEKRSNKSDGRLEVPAAWVRHLGWGAGQTVYVVIVDGENALTLCLPDDVNPDDTSLVTTKITPDSRLRVPKTAFVKANYPWTSDYVVRLEESSIKVSQDNGDDDPVCLSSPLSLPTATFTF